MKAVQETKDGDPDGYWLGSIKPYKIWLEDWSEEEAEALALLWNTQAKDFVLIGGKLAEYTAHVDRVARTKMVKDGKLVPLTSKVENDPLFDGRKVYAEVKALVKNTAREFIDKLIAKLIPEKIKILKPSGSTYTPASFEDFCVELFFNRMGFLPLEFFSRDLPPEVIALLEKHVEIDLPGELFNPSDNFIAVYKRAALSTRLGCYKFTDPSKGCSDSAQILDWQTKRPLGIFKPDKGEPFHYQNTKPIFKARNTLFSWAGWLSTKSGSDERERISAGARAFGFGDLGYVAGGDGYKAEVATYIIQVFVMHYAKQYIENLISQLGDSVQEDVKEYLKDRFATPVKEVGFIKDNIDKVLERRQNVLSENDKAIFKQLSSLSYLQGYTLVTETQVVELLFHFKDKGLDRQKGSFQLWVKEPHKTAREYLGVDKKFAGGADIPEIPFCLLELNTIISYLNSNSDGHSENMFFTTHNNRCSGMRLIDGGQSMPPNHPSAIFELEKLHLWKHLPGVDRPFDEFGKFVIEQVFKQRDRLYSVLQMLYSCKKFHMKLDERPMELSEIDLGRLRTLRDRMDILAPHARFDHSLSELASVCTDRQVEDHRRRLSSQSDAQLVRRMSGSLSARRDHCPNRSQSLPVETTYLVSKAPTTLTVRDLVDNEVTSGEGYHRTRSKSHK